MSIVRFVLGIALAAGWLASPLAAMEPKAATRVLVVIGAAGGEEFAPQFQAWAARWEQAAQKAGAAYHAIGTQPAGEKTDRALLQAALEEAAKSPPESLWLVLIGHGTFDGKTAKFNLRGPDITTQDLSAWLPPPPAQLAVVQCASSSGPFLAELSGANRAIITATRSGSEYNFARFGDFISAAIADPAADLDKDEQTSLLEAYLAASARLQEFYNRESRLATEHAMLDDNGDRQGTPADFFAGLRVVKQTKSGALPDGDLARRLVLVRSDRDEKLSPQRRAKRGELEQKLSALRQQKSKLPEAEYLNLIEPILVELARLAEEKTEPMAPP